MAKRTAAERGGDRQPSTRPVGGQEGAGGSRGGERWTRERFFASLALDEEVGCWVWTGPLEVGGYGYFGDASCGRKAHRYAYLAFVGPIPEGLQLDHLCRVRACVNPAHLEPVTPGENIRRGLTGQNVAARELAKTVCRWGHPLAGENVYHWRGLKRQCLACARIRQVAFRRAKALVQRRAARASEAAPA